MNFMGFFSATLLLSVSCLSFLHLSPHHHHTIKCVLVGTYHFYMTMRLHHQISWLINWLTSNKVFQRNTIWQQITLQLTAFRMASTGSIPIMAGSTPACAQDTILHKGCKDLFLASSALINTQTAAPSIKPAYSHQKKIGKYLNLKGKIWRFFLY